MAVIPAGSDGVVPVYNPDGLWTTWSIDQLFMGIGTPGADPNGNARYVGKVLDYVIDPRTDLKWSITAVDEATLTPTLKSLSPVIDDGDEDTLDLLYGQTPDTYMSYVDKSVLPNTITIDQRARVYTVLAKYCKIYRGTRIDSGGEVISAMYDASGNYLGENVPLILVAMPNFQNFAVKTVQTCFTKYDLADGETLTYVFFNDEGGVVSIRRTLVMNTAFARSVDQSLKYMTGISLESPFLTDSDPNLIRYPINVPIVSWNMFGVVHYSDGSKLRMPVDGTKFSVMGINDMVATVVGQQIKFTLKYSLSPDEVIYNAQTATPDGDRFKTENYRAIVLDADGAYTVKLYCLPVYNRQLQRYSLEWYIYDLDRDLAQLVTPFVSYATNRAGFVPDAYGVNQPLQVMINLNDVKAQYKKYIFTQTLNILLYRPATDHSGDPWAIWYEPGQAPPYGVGIKALYTVVNQNLKHLDISCGDKDLDTWLARILEPGKPLYNPQREAAYPKPNVFNIVKADGTEDSYTIDQWNQPILVSQSYNDADTLYVKLIYRTPENDLQIGIAPMTIIQQSP